MKKPEGHEWSLIDSSTNLHMCINCKIKITTGYDNNAKYGWFWGMKDGPFCPGKIPSGEEVKMENALG